MIDAKALREKVLDLAIRGKLVPQDPNDESASVLLERIRAEKQQMVKDGKLKPKDIKNDTIIFKGEDNLHYEQIPDGTVNCVEEELPFDIPNGWTWCRLENVSKIITDYVANGSFASLKANVRTYKEKNYALFVRTVDFAKDFKTDLSYIDKGSYNYLEKSKLFGGELMLSNIGASIGKVFKVPYFDMPMSLAPNSIVVRFFHEITTDYFEYVFKSFVGQNYLQYLSGGAAMPKFNKTDLRSMIVPIPPLNEQQKIINEIEKAFNYIDIIEGNHFELESTITTLKSKILDLAIHGKLVIQDPNDEPASILLERIREEKEELIKQGKIKRDKKESIIFKGEDNSYYRDIPTNWCLVSFSDIATLISGRDLKPDKYNSCSIGIPYITGASNFSDGVISVNRWTEYPQSISIKNDILLTCKGTVGEISINCYEKVHIARQIMAIRVNKNIILDYIKLFFLSIITKIKNSANGLIPGISRSDILNLNVPIPPSAEQQKIVNYVKNIFNIIDNII